MFAKKSSFRFILISATLIALAAITVNANWGFNFFAATEAAAAPETAAPPAAMMVPTVKTVCNTGTPTLPSIAAAVTDANTNFPLGDVTYDVCAGHTETITATLSLVATGTNGPITFEKSGAGLNPVITAFVGTATPGSTVQDGIFNMVGSDNVTIDGIDLLDPNTTNPATMEYGYSLFKASPTNGAQGNTIRNCTVTLSLNNNAAGNTVSVDGSRGIQMINALDTAQTAAVAVTSAAGSNSNNKFYHNTIQNVNIGMAMIGFADATPFANADTNNDIGGTSAATGNTIKNFGGAAAAANPAAGIRNLAQYGLNISWNTVNSNDGGGANHPNTLRGIYMNTAVSASETISHNTITVISGATTSQLLAIDNVGGATAASNTVAITDNLITNCAYPTATTGAFFGVQNTAGPANLSISNNTFSGNSTNATSGTQTMITSTGAPTVSANFNFNNINGWTWNAVSSGAFTGISTSAPAAACPLSISSNNFQGITYAISGTGAHTYINWSHGNSVADSINLNTYTNLNVNTTGSINFMTRGTTNQTATGSISISNNSIVTGFNKGSAGGTVTFLNTGAGDTSPLGSTMTETGNNFSNVTLTGATTVAGWSELNGPTSGLGVSKTITGNTFSNISTGSASVTCMAENFGGNGTTVSSNTISNVTNAPTATGLTLTGISHGTSNGGAVQTVANNSVSGLSSTGTGGQVIGITSGSTLITTLNINNNRTFGISSASSAGPVVSGIFNGATGTTVNIFKNKIYDITCTPGAVIGLNSTASAATTTVNMYNNIVGRLYATASLFFQSARGILLQGASAANFNVSYNTVYLDGTTPTQTYCLYIGTTANFPNVNPIDNAFINNVSSSNGAANPQTAYFRFGTTNATNLASTANNNALYAGTPGVDHLIYVDGAVNALTNPKQTLGDYQAFVATRENQSVTELPPFANTTDGSLANYLHIDTSLLPTLLDAHGVPVAGITDDYDGDTRNPSTPDIGADEFLNSGPTPTSTATFTPTNTLTPTATATSTATPCTGGTFSFTGPAVAILDSPAAGVSVNIPVSGLGLVNDLNFSFDGTQSADPLSTTPGINHSWVGDLIVTVKAPGAGPSVVVFDRPGVPATVNGCNSNNLAQLLLDDDGGFPAVEAQCGVDTNAAFPIGTFSPNNALSTFDGVDPNGTWTVTVSDNAGGDTGSLRAVSLVISAGCAGTPTATSTATSTPTASPTPTNTSTPTATATCTPQNFVNDGGFETGGIPSTIWNNPQTSTNFGTALCDVPSCTTGGGASPPRTGAIWAWFGGIALAETATLGQSVTVPTGTPSLHFWMRIGTVSSPFTDVLNVKVDGTIVQTYTEPAVAEAAYTERVIDMTPFANGGTHNITFEYIETSGGISSYVVDDVSLITGVACDASPTPTATATATATPTAELSGTVTYGNAIGAPAVRPVSNVLISGMGSPNVSTTTVTGTGTYSLTGFGSGAYTVTPSKSGASNGSITSFDAARIAQHSAGVGVPLTGNALIVADTSGTSGVSSFDAGLVARFAAGLQPPPANLSGNWIFQPVSRTYPSVTVSMSGQDYAALLMGEVSGNWPNGLPGRHAGPERSTAVIAPRLVTPADSEIIVPVSVEGAANKGIISYEFDLRYDPAVIQPQANPVELAGTVSSKLSAVANAKEAGLLRVVVYGTMPVKANGVLMNLRFTAVGAAGSVSPLTWESLMFNEGDPRTMATDGQVELSRATPNQAEITGRLLTTMGQGVANARVTLTDSTGQTRSILSNGFGIYRFGNLQVGQTYTVSVDSRRFTFAPLTVSVTEQLVNMDMIAAQ